LHPKTNFEESGSAMKAATDHVTIVRHPIRHRVSRGAAFLLAALASACSQPQIGGSSSIGPIAPILAVVEVPLPPASAADTPVTAAISPEIAATIGKRRASPHPLAFRQFVKVEQATSPPATVASHEVAALGPGVDVRNLADIRGGYFNAAGVRFDIGLQMRTLVNGQEFLSTLYLGGPGQAANTLPAVQNIAGVNGQATTITHNFSNLSTTIVNSQDGANINNTTSMTLTLFGQRQIVSQVTAGLPTIANPKLSNMTHDALVGALAH
jgi:hypothetical protein